MQRHGGPGAHSNHAGCSGSCHTATPLGHACPHLGSQGYWCPGQQPKALGLGCLVGQWSTGCVGRWLVCCRAAPNPLFSLFHKFRWTLGDTTDLPKPQRHAWSLPSLFGITSSLYFETGCFYFFCLPRRAVLSCGRQTLRGSLLRGIGGGGGGVWGWRGLSCHHPFSTNSVIIRNKVRSFCASFPLVSKKDLASINAVCQCNCWFFVGICLYIFTVHPKVYCNYLML